MLLLVWHPSGSAHLYYFAISDNLLSITETSSNSEILEYGLLFLSLNYELLPRICLGEPGVINK